MCAHTPLVSATAKLGFPLLFVARLLLRHNMLDGTKIGRAARPLLWAATTFGAPRPALAALTVARFVARRVVARRAGAGSAASASAATAAQRAQAPASSAAKEVTHGSR
ncbi:MAG: hypothetical protein EOO41_00015 [Methanobacteriota archaeon]|nr:MAG: hypothetical protein EOO41_00015 [Euryarchaeota archaeon]